MVIFDSDRLFSRKNEQFLRRLFRSLPKNTQKIIVSDGLSKTPESAMGFSKQRCDKTLIEISSISIDSVFFTFPITGGFMHFRYSYPIRTPRGAN